MHSIYMDYTSTLETLEVFSNALARHYAHQVADRAILYPLVKVRFPGIALGCKQRALFTLVCFLSVPYRWNTQVL